MSRAGWLDRMVKGAIVGLALASLIFVAPRADAHRLDEYLLATTVSIEQDEVVLDLKLTPGMLVAGSLLRTLDADGNGIIRPAAQLAYARSVERGLQLTIDGAAAPLRLTGYAYPPAPSLRDGVGIIALELRAALSQAPGRHRLVFANRHGGSNAVYLVNTRQPSDLAIRVLGQRRSQDQSIYTLDVSVGDAARSGAETRDDDAGGWPLVRTFFWHGVHHILTGYDHLLFGLALALGAATLLDLIAVITVFTIAHSFTVTLAALGLVHVPDGIVEPIIAASIIAVALQNVLRPSATRGSGRLLAAFLFGLFHGLGFAAGLLDIMQAMPRNDVVLAILGFSVGIEAGNQLVLLPCFAFLSALGHAQGPTVAERPAKMRRVISIAIAIAGTYFLGLALVGRS